MTPSLMRRSPTAPTGTGWWERPRRPRPLEFALGGYTVILDSPIFPEGAEGVAKICGRHGLEVHYAVLRADLGTCLERSQRRDPAGPPDVDDFRLLHARFVDLDRHEGHVIDASGPPEQVREAVLTGFRSGRLALGGAAPVSPR